MRRIDINQTSALIFIALILGGFGLGLGSYSIILSSSEGGGAGASGVDGTDGTNGADGTDGVNGTDGTNGADGTDGADGADGAVGPPGSDNIVSLTSGTYMGLQLFGKSVLIPEGNNVKFQNAQIYGGDLYVYGVLTLKNSSIDHDIHGHNNGLINITKVETIEWSAIHLHENSKAIINNATLNYVYLYDKSEAIINNTSSYYLVELYGNSNLTISNCVGPNIRTNDKSTANISNYAGAIHTFDESIVKMTYLLDSYYSNAMYQNSSITMYGSSQATVRSSNLNDILCFEQIELYILENTNASRLYCYGTPFIYNTAIIYRDGTSVIRAITLNDAAQVIDI